MTDVFAIGLKGERIRLKDVVVLAIRNTGVPAKSGFGYARCEIDYELTEDSVEEIPSPD